MSRILILCFLLRLSLIYATPVRIKCEEIDIPYNRLLCNLDKYEKDHANVLESDFFEIHRRNSELSSAMNFLYGPGSARYPGKRNNFQDPEQFSAMAELIKNGSA